ncbi:MAG TPA: FAD-linked oxidase C-terminal domain-containing protein [Solirubrobacteraceae bacterium]|jgi:glycolate oxidase subunit GlcD
MSASLGAELAALLDSERVLCPVPADSPYNSDTAGAWRGLRGSADAVVLPERAEEVAAVIELCVRKGLPLVPRGGGSGVSGGACPTVGGIVCSLERMRSVLALEPGLWRMRVGAGLLTSEVQRLANENGLLFPPDPGAAEQSQIGGNVATDAGGPHAFKYGSTRNWVTGLEVVIPPGQVLQLGGDNRKDVAGYALHHLIAGSEGTLGVITAVTLRLIPRPEQALSLVAFLRDRAAGCEAVLTVLGSGILAATIEVIDGEALRQIAGAYPGEVPEGSGFALLCEVDGGIEQTRCDRDELARALAEDAIRVDLHDVQEPLRRWRAGVSGAVAAVYGGKVSEDVVVPPKHLKELLDGFDEHATAAGLQSCAWGHGGDGNIHATVMLDPEDATALKAAEQVMGALFELAIQLGGSISGEHGLGWVKRSALGLQYPPQALALQRRVKQAFDQSGVMNPDKKLP